MIFKTTTTRSFLFTLILVLFSINASHGYDNVGNRYGVDSNNITYNAPINPFCANNQCDQSTAFAWGRAYDRLGIDVSPRGNACSWWSTPDVHYSQHPVDEPRANSFAVWQDPSGLCDSSHRGHVAYVEEVDGNDVYINEADWETPGFNEQTRRFTRSEMLNRNGYILQGYLHLNSPFSSYYSWDFFNQGTADWTAGNALSQGIYFDALGYYWEVGSFFGDNTQVRQIFSPLLNDIYTDEFNAIEITFRENSTILNSINGWFKINNTWQGPVAIARVSGPGTSGSANIYRGSIPPYNDQIQQVRFAFDQGSGNISIYDVSFYHTLSGFITDANNDATEWHIIARETSGANLGNYVTTNDLNYQMSLFPGNYAVHCESYIYLSTCTLTISSPDQNIAFPQDDTYNPYIPLLNYNLVHITGFVKNDQGEGIEGVEARAESYDGKCASSSASDADGFFDLSVISGFPSTYNIVFRAPNDMAYVNNSITLNDIISNTFLGDIVLTSLARYFFSGYFIDENGIQTLDGYSSAQINADNSSIGHSIWTGTTDGNFIFSLFVEGSYTLSAFVNNDYNNGNSQTSTSTTYQVFDYILGPNNLEILLPSYEYYLMDGVVTDMKGIPLSGVRMDISGFDGRCSGWSFSDSHGYYSLRLIPGQYSLTFTAPPDAYPPFQINCINITDDCRRNIRLSRDYAILDEALNQLSSDLDIALDVFDIINQGNSLSYDIEVTGDRNILEIIPNWTSSGVSVEIFNPEQISQGTYPSPARITIPNPTPGTWTCEVTAVSVPYNNFPFALVAGLTQNQEPVAMASASGTYNGYVNTTILLDARNSSDSDGAIVRYEWDWDNDGTYEQSSVSPTISHTWAAPNSYTVNLRVTDNSGLDSIDSCIVNISTRPPDPPVPPVVTTYTLNASVGSGSGTIRPASGTYSQGTVVNLSAAPGSGYQVKAWHGTNNDSSKSFANSVTMNANRTVTVEFEPVPAPSEPETNTYALNVSVTNGHGSITAFPSSGPYSQGTSVSLSATPESGYKVKAWAGTDNDTSTADSNTVTMNADHVVTVEFMSVSNPADPEENKGGGGGGGGGCFMSTSTTGPLPLSVASLIMILVLFFGLLFPDRALRNSFINR